MKKMALLVALLSFVMLSAGCAAGSAVGRGLKKSWENFCGSGTYVPMPPPQGGLVLPVNQSPGVWAECWLFQGHIREKDLFISCPTNKGQLTLTNKPLKHFTINPPMAQNHNRSILSTAITVPLLLSARPMDYTLLVFHKNFRDWVVKTEVHRFKTTGYPFNDYYESGGRRIYADRVIELARVKPYEHRQFQFHRIYYPGHALIDALGLPYGN